MTDEEERAVQIAESNMISALASNMCQPILTQFMDQKRYIGLDESAMLATNAVRVAKAIVAAQREIQ